MIFHLGHDWEKVILFLSAKVFQLMQFKVGMFYNCITMRMPNMPIELMAASFKAYW